MKITNFRIRYAVMVIIPVGALFAWFLVRPYLSQTNISTIASPAGLSSIKVPEGFHVDLFAKDLAGPRFIHFGPDNALYIAERKAGRIIANGFPTGVEVADPMVHSGPYPASTNFGASSVGSISIRRFLRPVCYQDIPVELLNADTRPTS